jgi:hypothetical protein
VLSKPLHAISRWRESSRCTQGSAADLAGLEAAATNL